METLLIVEEKVLCAASAANLLASMGIEGRPAFAASLSEALRAPDLHLARLALVDLPSIGFDFEGLRRLALATKAPVVVIDDRSNFTFAKLAQRAGARGYICQTYGVDQVQALLRSILDGGEQFPRSLRLGRLAATPLQIAGLTPRQLEVLKCITVGMANLEIARALGITPGTVKLHIHAILRTTGARNRTELALSAGRLLAPSTES